MFHVALCCVCRISCEGRRSSLFSKRQGGDNNNRTIHIARLRNSWEACLVYRLICWCFFLWLRVRFPEYAFFAILIITCASPDLTTRKSLLAVPVTLYNPNHLQQRYPATNTTADGSDTIQQLWQEDFHCNNKASTTSSTMINVLSTATQQQYTDNKATIMVMR